MERVKMFIIDTKIYYCNKKIKKLNRKLNFCNFALVSQSTLMMDLPKYKQMKKEMEVELSITNNKLSKLLSHK